MKRVSMIVGVVLLVALAGIMVQRQTALSARVGALSARVTRLEEDKSALLARVSELQKDLNGVTAKVVSEIQDRTALQADVFDWIESANGLFRALVQRPGPTTVDNNPCGPGSLEPFINADGTLACW